MWFAAAQTGTTVLSALSGYKAQKAQYKVQKRLQEYRNKMTRITAALSQNAITDNVILTQKQAARKAVGLRREEMSTVGSATVAAAAAGVRGRSVNQTLVDVQRNYATQEFLRTSDLKDAFAQFDQQRLNTEVQATLSMDHSFIEKPSLGAALLKIGSSVAEQGMRGDFKDFGKLFKRDTSNSYTTDIKGQMVGTVRVR